MQISLTQVVFAVRDLATGVADWRVRLGLGPGVRDPEMATFGLDHEVLGVGDETVLEIVSPTRDDAAVARLLARHGADCGYMLALHVQGGDYDAFLERISRAGITPTLATAFRASSLVQLHPRDFGTLLQVSFLDARWHWVEQLATHTTGTVADAIVSVQVAVADPEATAVAWRQLLDLPAAAAPVVTLDRGAIEFVPSKDSAGLVGMSVRAVDRSRVGESVQLSGINLGFV